MEAEALSAILSVLEGLSGATAFGLSLALWATHEPDKPWEMPSVAVLGVGWGAAVSYLVTWLEPVRSAFVAWLGGM
jgi:hypothetical protein